MCATKTQRKSAAYLRNQRRRAGRRYVALRQYGLCIACKCAVPGTAMCRACADAYNARRRAARAEGGA